MFYFVFIYLKVISYLLESSLARLIILSILLILSKKLVLISAVSSTNMVGAVVNSWLKKANSIAKRSHSLTLKNLTLNTMNAMRSITKTKPKQSQTKPSFQGSNLNLSEITRIVADFRQHFLCKTKPNNANLQKLTSEYETPINTNYATCPAPTLRLFHKVGAVETKPNSVVGIQIPVEYDMSEKVNYATCPAPTLRLFRKVGAVETKPNFPKIQIENKGLTTVSTCPAPKSLVLWQSSVDFDQELITLQGCLPKGSL